MGFNYKQFRAFVSDTLIEMDKVIPYSESALNLLLGSCAQETLFGTFLHQIDGPGEGAYSMEPNTQKDIWANWLMSRYPVRVALTKACGICSYRNNNALRWNLKYATIMARIQYRRFKDPLPPANNPRKMGEYWKAAYNKTGKGTVEEFIGNYMHYCK